MQRVIAYCLHFIDRCKHRNIEIGMLSRVETDRTLMVAIKITQNVHWAQKSYWKRWSHEYLHIILQGQQKWYTDNPTLAIGDLVVINSPLRPVMAWQLGRVIAVHPGLDDVVRVVTLKTAEGILKRPVVKLVKLPVF